MLITSHFPLPVQKNQFPYEFSSLRNNEIRSDKIDERSKAMQEFADNYAIAVQILMRHRIHNKTPKVSASQEKQQSSTVTPLHSSLDSDSKRNARKCFAGWAKAIKLSKSLEGFEDDAAFHAATLCRELMNI